MFPKNKNGALAALLFAGGLWAWQNRDKVQGWISSQSQQLGGSQPQPSQPQPNQPFTGETRRMPNDGSSIEGLNVNPGSFDAKI